MTQSIDFNKSTLIAVTNSLNDLIKKGRITTNFKEVNRITKLDFYLSVRSRRNFLWRNLKVLHDIGLIEKEKRIIFLPREKISFNEILKQEQANI